VVLPAPAVAGTYQIRAVAAQATVSGQTFPAYTTPTASLRVVAQSATLTLPAPALSGEQVSAAMTFLPARPGRPVALQVQVERGWNTVGSGSQNSLGSASISFRAVPGIYRAVTLASNGAAAAVSPTRDLVVTSPLPPASASSISAGAVHTCALTTTGAIRCWGYNGAGALGNGTTVDSPVPVQVTQLGGTAVGVTAGDLFTCALIATGGVRCWGSNADRQLGNGGTADSSVPVNVVGLNGGVAAVSAGGGHACAVTLSGAAKCWGGNQYGQLGNGSVVSSSVPVDVAGLGSGVVGIASGGNHSCALTAAGAVKCWGANFDGGLGDGTLTDSAVPVDVVGLGSGVTKVEAGALHTCALMDLGTVKCWGSGDFGQLGGGTFASSAVPVDVTGLTGVAVLSAGAFHSCAATAAGAATCWGGNWNG
jgi:alpha-tubulin suppressor-like RCC1 family protein